MDLLSDLLHSADGATLLSYAQYQGPWGIRFGDGQQLGLHVVESGQCSVGLNGEWTQLNAGDVALFPRGDPHVVADRARRRATTPEAYTPRPGPNRTRMMCACQRNIGPHHPLLSALPALVHIEGDEISRCPTLSPVLRLIKHELQDEQPGRSLLVRQLLHTFIVYVVRHWLENTDIAEGWVGAVRDPRLLRTLSAMHAHPEHDWTVAKLSQLAHMSTPTFARAFRRQLEQTPLVYLTELRMARAARLLRGGDPSLADVAERVGYQSEFAFSRAFKRTMGVPPSVYRSERGQL